MLVVISYNWLDSYSLSLQESANHVRHCIEPACPGAQGMAEGPSFCKWCLMRRACSGFTVTVWAVIAQPKKKKKKVSSPSVNTDVLTVCTLLFNFSGICCCTNKKSRWNHESHELGMCYSWQEGGNVFHSRTYILWQLHICSRCKRACVFLNKFYSLIRILICLAFPMLRALIRCSHLFLILDNSY